MAGSEHNAHQGQDAELPILQLLSQALHNACPLLGGGFWLEVLRNIRQHWIQVHCGVWAYWTT
jgi:hypothetical protein